LRYARRAVTATVTRPSFPPPTPPTPTSPPLSRLRLDVDGVACPDPLAPRGSPRGGFRGGGGGGGGERLERSGVKRTASTALGMTDTRSGGTAERSTVFSFAGLGFRGFGVRVQGSYTVCLKFRV